MSTVLPRSDLAPESVPWGRWVDETVLYCRELQSVLGEVTGTSSSTGAAQGSVIGRQIRELQLLAQEIEERNLFT